MFLVLVRDVSTAFLAPVDRHVGSVLVAQVVPGWELQILKRELYHGSAVRARYEVMLFDIRIHECLPNMAGGQSWC